MVSNYFFYDSEIEYPVNSPYHPEMVYPEYPFKCIDPKGISTNIAQLSIRNDVYRGIRLLLKNLGLDNDHFGTSEWNPLGEYISPGQTVLIKPNLVNHANPAEKDLRKGMDCLITHPSVVRCIFDYVFIALKNKGRIIIADAPVQGCEFVTMLNRTGYGDLLEYLCKKNTDKLEILFVDLRETIFCKENGVNVQRGREDIVFPGITVDLGKDSFFDDVVNKSKLRITDYDSRDTVKHHTTSHNEYCISAALLEADVVISIPKPKTHRIAGYTGALKNLIGVNARKEFLPHHQSGSVLSGGDEYTNTHRYLKKVNSKSHDFKNLAMKIENKRLQEIFDSIGRKTGRLLDVFEPDRNKNGMWSGNDTIWRTILDVNHAVLFANKKGIMCKEPQRTLLHFGDMVVCGDHEGPLKPSYKKVGGIMFSTNSVAFDLILVKLMGFDMEHFPVLVNAVADKCLVDFKSISNLVINSNNSDFDQKTIQDQIKSFDFVPTNGWEKIFK